MTESDGNIVRRAPLCTEKPAGGQEREEPRPPRSRERRRTAGVSVVIPAYNEQPAVAEVVRDVQTILDGQGRPFEVIVVDDGSDDDTARCAQEAGAAVLQNPSNKGYGFSLLRGIEHARYDLVAILDADGSYPPQALPSLLEEAERYDMVVARRLGDYYTGGFLKRFSRTMFRLLAEFTAGARIPDINSGMRVFRRSFVLRHKSAISTGYSFTTTVTLIALLEGLHLKYVDVPYGPRKGRSKVRWVRDTLRSLQIVTEVILLYNPLKFYLLLALMCGAAWLTLPLVWIAAGEGVGWFATALAVGFSTAATLLGVGGAAFAAGVAGRRRMPTYTEMEGVVRPESGKQKEQTS